MSAALQARHDARAKALAAITDPTGHERMAAWERKIAACLGPANLILVVADRERVCASQILDGVILVDPQAAHALAWQAAQAGYPVPQASAEP